jgi:hypothetical protein
MTTSGDTQTDSNLCSHPNPDGGSPCCRPLGHDVLTDHWDGVDTWPRSSSAGGDDLGRQLEELEERRRYAALKPIDGARLFTLERDEDVTGVSGSGTVAEGVVFSDGTVALRWLSEWPTSVVFHDRGLEAVDAVHGHGGKTRIEFR